MGFDKNNNMIQVRLAKKEDIDEIVFISKQVNEMVMQNRSEFLEKPREFLRTYPFYLKAIKEKDSVIFVAENKKGKIAGYVYANIEKEPDDLITIPYVSINEIAVRREFQGFGIGKFLMKQIEKWAEENGIYVIRLSVWEFNKKALNFYKKIGYKTIMRKMEKVIKNFYNLHKDK